MTSFGIIAKFGPGALEFGIPEEHYLGHDPVLWDWLQADNYEPAGCTALKVKAPAGYEFFEGALLPKQAGRESSDYQFVSFESPQNGKALMVLEALKFVSPTEFYDHEIDEERIMDIVIY